MATTVMEKARPESVQRMADGLGWFSLGLGVPQLLAPGQVDQLTGVRDDAKSRTAQRLVGVRELAAAAGLLGTDRRAPFVWGRVAGDAMDLLLLARAWMGKRASTSRLFAATASVAGITVLDVMTAVRMTNDPRTQKRRTTVKTAAVTLDVTREEAEAAWSRFAADAGAPGTPTFRPAPGRTATEVLLRVEESNPVVDTARKALGTEPYQQAKDALRRFKQLVETGEIARSDAMPEGETHERMFPRQRPAQPLDHQPA
jgi:hypothetical protein